MKVKTHDKPIIKRPDTSPKWYKLLSDFNDSPATSVELVPGKGEYKNIKAAQSTACTAIRRHGFNMRTVCEDGRLYLVKTLKEGDK